MGPRERRSKCKRLSLAKRICESLLGLDLACRGHLAMCTTPPYAFRLTMVPEPSRLMITTLPAATICRPNLASSKGGHLGTLMNALRLVQAAIPGI